MIKKKKVVFFFFVTISFYLFKLDSLGQRKLLAVINGAIG